MPSSTPQRKGFFTRAKNQGKNERQRGREQHEQWEQREPYHTRDKTRQRSKSRGRERVRVKRNNESSSRGMAHSKRRELQKVRREIQKVCNGPVMKRFSRSKSQGTKERKRKIDESIHGTRGFRSKSVDSQRLAIKSYSRSRSVGPRRRRDFSLTPKIDQPGILTTRNNQPSSNNILSSLLLYVGESVHILVEATISKVTSENVESGTDSNVTFNSQPSKEESYACNQIWSKTVQTFQNTFTKPEDKKLDSEESKMDLAGFLESSSLEDKQLLLVLNGLTQKRNDGNSELPKIQELHGNQERINLPKNIEEGKKISYKSFSNDGVLETSNSNGLLKHDVEDKSCGGIIEKFKGYRKSTFCLKSSKQGRKNVTPDTHQLNDRDNSVGLQNNSRLEISKHVMTSPSTCANTRANDTLSSQRQAKFMPQIPSSPYTSESNAETEEIAQNILLSTKTTSQKKLYLNGPIRESEKSNDNECFSPGIEGSHPMNASYLRAKSPNRRLNKKSSTKTSNRLIELANDHKYFPALSQVRNIALEDSNNVAGSVERNRSSAGLPASNSNKDLPNDMYGFLDLPSRTVSTEDFQKDEMPSKYTNFSYPNEMKSFLPESKIFMQEMDRKSTIPPSILKKSKKDHIKESSVTFENTSSRRPMNQNSRQTFVKKGMICINGRKV